MTAAKAIFRRDLARYFTSPTGYVFIAIFILLSAYAQFWQDKFFQNNLADLAMLNEWFPYILIFFIPAVAMGTWADERRHGTDELLLTLPARDGEIVIGKYLAALGIYSISLALALSYIIVLSYLGRPDLGLMFSTYLGYWLLGASLLAVAMIGSFLSENITVGFILGAVFSAIPIFLGKIGGLLGRSVASAGVENAFSEFTTGVLTLGGLAYFGSFTAVALTINLYLLRRRRMSRGRWHLPIRATSFVVAAVGLCILCGRAGGRTDMTAEKLRSLSKATREVLGSLEADRPVFIEAYISPEVPKEYSETRETLLGFLREYDALGKGRLVLRINETDKSSDAAHDADERFKIKPVPVEDKQAGRATTTDVFLGVAFTCGLEETVIPFMFKGYSIEYELTRSIRLVAKSRLRKIGILATDANWFGAFDFQRRRPGRDWAVVDELKKQYEVLSIPTGKPIEQTLDALIVPMASSLTQPQMDALLGYIKKGNPTLLLDDPLPYTNQELMPGMPKRPRNPYDQQGETPGDVRGFYRGLGVDWDPTEVVWDAYNPRPAWHLPPELVWISKGNGAAEPFNPDSPITSGLQEVLLFYSGRIRSTGDRNVSFVPLLHAGSTGGTIHSDELGGRVSHRPRQQSSDERVVAARLEGRAPAEKKDAPDTQVNAIMVCDIDLISDLFFYERQQRSSEVIFDNIPFLLNCVDSLAGDEGFIELRKRRPRHRTLEALEKVIRSQEEQRLKEEKAAQEEADKKLRDWQKNLVDVVNQIRAGKESPQIIEAAVERENRRLEVSKQNVEDEKKAAIARSEAARDRAIKQYQSEIKLLALLLPPIPAFALGLIILIYRIKRELEARR